MYYISPSTQRDEVELVMEKSPVISKARALGLARALKLITRAFLGFADPIDFINVTDLMSLYTVQYTIVKWFFITGSFSLFNVIILRVFFKVKLLFFPYIFEYLI